MCGIAGYILKNAVRNAYKDPEIIFSSLRKRGPDDEGACLISRRNRKITFYRTENTVKSVENELKNINDQASFFSHDVAFFHTRYSIIDLTAKGHQPFQSADGNVVGIFNGEIYNYIELRDELSSCGVNFRTNSDTEVLVEGYNYWGEKLWTRMNGFWAFCLYDVKEDLIILSRDRIGVAPLYYYETDEAFFFSSYINTLLNIADKRPAPDHDIITGFIQTGIKDHDNTTFYEGIKSVPSASVIKIKADKFSLNDSICRRYWHLPEERLESKNISFDSAVKEFRNIFFDAVKIRLRADVKIAFELSGGLDSSSIIAAAAELSKDKLSTFTAKIKNADEEPFARSMLRKYDIDYNVVEHIEEDFIRDHNEFSELMEEPYDNPNNYTHNRMLEYIKSRGVDVIITGAGGDEVFAGYEASFWPKVYRELRAKGGKDYLIADLYEFRRRFKTVKSSLSMLRHYFFDPFKLLFRRIGTPRSGPGGSFETSALLLQRKYNTLNFHESVLFHFNTALIPYYMRSSDHFTMGIPIEHRFPFLDYRIVEFGLKMPAEYLFRNGWTKYLVRKAMEPYLPEKILWRRKKMGFTFPYKKYFKQKSSHFKPILRKLYSKDASMTEFGSYDELLKKDPVLLWRLLSVAIWGKRNL